MEVDGKRRFRQSFIFRLSREAAWGPIRKAGRGGQTVETSKVWGQSNARASVSVFDPDLPAQVVPPLLIPLPEQTQVTRQIVLGFELVSGECEEIVGVG